MSKQGEYCYVPLNCSDGEDDYITQNISDFEIHDDNVDKFLKIYAKDSIFAKIIFTMFLMNPAFRLLFSGILRF